MDAKRIYLTGEERKLLRDEMRSEKKICTIWCRRYFPKSWGTPREKVPTQCRSEYQQRLKLLTSILRKLR